jgi:hypothetical protein
MLFMGKNLYVVQNKGVNIVSELGSTDDWNTATLKAATTIEDRFQNPSTLTASGNQLYALNAKLNELSDSTLPKSKEFSLQLVQCRPIAK